MKIGIATFASLIAVTLTLAPSAYAGIRSVGRINYANNPGTLSFQIPTQFATAVTIDNSACPGVSVNYVQVYSTERLIPTARISDTSFSVNGGYGAYLFGLAVTTSGWGVCQLDVLLED